eukprot:gene7257-12943_t
MKLMNRKASGPDYIPAEKLKTLRHKIAGYMAKILNEHFKKGTSFEIREGLLVLIRKPGKTNTAGNFRSVLQLDTTRKVFANIVLARIKDKIEGYLSPSQTAYRKNHS